MPGFRGWPTLSVDGPLARTVRDLAVLLAVMAGPTPLDESALAVPLGDVLGAVERADVAGPRGGAAGGLGFPPGRGRRGGAVGPAARPPGAPGGGGRGGGPPPPP